MTRLDRTRKAIELRRIQKAYPWLSPDELEALWDGALGHFSAHQIPYEESQAAYQQTDITLPNGNTTVGAGLLPFTTNAQLTLNSINATTPEVRTLVDPLKAFQFINMTLVQKVAQNLVVRCQTPIWLGATLTQPAITQLGQFINFTATNHTISLQSVPALKQSYAGTQATFVNTTGFRWMVQISDGPTVT